MSTIVNSPLNITHFYNPLSLLVKNKYGISLKLQHEPENKINILLTIPNILFDIIPDPKFFMVLNSTVNK